jgi:alpha-mannosidase
MVSFTVIAPWPVRRPPGVHARYRVYPHSGGFHPSDAQRRGLETAASQPLLQHMGEPASDLVYPKTGTLLQLPEALDPAKPVFTLHVKPARVGAGVTVRLYNAGSEPCEAHLASGLLKIETATLCDLTEAPGQPLPVTNGGLVVTLPSGQVSTIHLTVKP